MKNAQQNATKRLLWPGARTSDFVVSDGRTTLLCTPSIGLDAQKVQNSKHLENVGKWFRLLERQISFV